LLIHAARHYGVEAVGVTLSGVQAKWAEQAIADAGLRDRARIELCDYREFREPGKFDKAASVGMSEHIGNRNLPKFLGKIHECLRPGGAYLHHCITLRPGDPLPVWKDFAWKYVFPNGELQTIVHTVATATRVGFEVRDVESLREHYILTLQHWIRRLVANHDQILQWTDEVGYRIFRLYMSGAIGAFRSGVCNLYQCLLVRPDSSRPEDCRSGLPLTRADWYA
jgi:cyclopropane-fatty-acyl-phospholipid synthase